MTAVKKVSIYLKNQIFIDGRISEEHVVSISKKFGIKREYVLSIIKRNNLTLEPKLTAMFSYLEELCPDKQYLQTDIAKLKEITGFSERYIGEKVRAIGYTRKNKTLPCRPNFMCRECDLPHLSRKAFCEEHSTIPIACDFCGEIKRISRISFTSRTSQIRRGLVKNSTYWYCSRSCSSTVLGKEIGVCNFRRARERFKVNA